MKKKIFFIAAIALICAVNVQAQVAVIVNKSVSVSSVNANKLSDLYSLSVKTWDNGTKVVVFDRKSDDDTKTSFYSFIGKSSSAMKKVWMRVQLSGEGTAPDLLGSDDDVLKKVASTPGAIGYVSADKVTADVKVVATIK